MGSASLFLSGSGPAVEQIDIVSLLLYGTTLQLSHVYMADPASYSETLLSGAGQVATGPLLYRYRLDFFYGRAVRWGTEWPKACAKQRQPIRVCRYYFGSLSRRWLSMGTLAQPHTKRLGLPSGTDAPLHNSGRLQTEPRRGEVPPSFKL